MTRRSMVMAAATLLLGCACGTAMETEELAETSSKIIKGTDSNRESVVLLRYFDGAKAGASCTGTMIAKNLVLTARHCVSRTVGTRVVSERDVTEMFVFTGIAAPAASATKAGADARGLQSVIYAGEDVIGQDVALVVLDQDVNVPLASVAEEPPTEGEKLVAVGYGRNEDNLVPAKRQERTNRTVIASDGPTFELDESACLGDSGGPAMRAGNVIVGVDSRISGGDGVGSGGICVGPNTRAEYTSVTSVAKLVAFGRKTAAEERAARP